MLTLTTRKALLLTVAAMAITTTRCDSPDCTPTATAATPADKVSLRQVGDSSVLVATLTADEAPLSGKNLTFDVLDDGSSVYQGSASTGADGMARFDLKRIEANALASAARGDEFRASFAGDATYCSSSDTADFHVTTV